MRLQKLIFLFAFIIFSFLFSRVAFADESFINIASDVTFSNPAVGSICGWNSGSYNNPYLFGYHMYRDTFPNTNNLTVYSNSYTSNSAISGCGSPVQLEGGFLNGAANTPDGNYWVKMTATGSPYNPDWGNSTSYYFEANRTEGVWSLTGVPTSDSGALNIPCTEDCFSNVLFLPGLMGSKLYGSNENELWVSGSDSDHTDLLLDNQGKSIDSSIHTKDDTQILEGDDGETGVIDEIFTLNIYKSFLKSLKDWKDEKLIKDYAFIPYDWRLSLEDIITNGFSTNGNLSYNTTQDFSESFVLKKLEALQSNSKSGKVTIIAHSNGGLVAKAFIQKLKDTNNPLYEKIDKVILVAVPQVGTPDAVIALLHGTELGNGFIMDKDRARQLSENMPTVYNLLPSESYFNTVDQSFAVDKIVSFEDSPIFSSKISEYGLFVSNSNEQKNYVLGTDARQKPDFDDTSNPNIGNSFLYSQSENLHNILDSWEPFTDTKVIQVAGWGVETLAGLDYKSYRDVSEHISYTPRFVIDGDSTVVVPSALWMSDSKPNVERWWVNLNKYNRDSLILKTKHRNILEINNLSDFIKFKIQDFEFFDPENIVVDNTSTLATNDFRRLHFILHSPLTLGITDREGNYTGIDPETNEIREEIPNADYRQIGEVQFLSVPAGGEYTLKLDGYADGYFSLELEEQEGNSILNSKLFEGVPTSLDTSVTLEIDNSFDVLSSELNIDQDGNGSVDIVYPIKNQEVSKVEENKDSDTYGFKKEDNLETIVNKIEEIEHIVEKPSIVKTSDDFIEKPKEEKIEKEIENKEIEIPQEVVKDKDIDLGAFALESDFLSEKLSYIIILGLLIVLALIRKFIKI